MKRLLVFLIAVTATGSVSGLRAGLSASWQQDLAVLEGPGGITVFLADPGRGALLSGKAAPDTRLMIADMKVFTDCGPFGRPVALAVRESRLVVVDMADGASVVECNLETKARKDLWKGEPLRYPGSVAIAAEGGVAVLDREMRGLFVLPGGSEKPRVLRAGDMPLNVRADERGTLYLLDGEDGIQRVDTFDTERGYRSLQQKGSTALMVSGETTFFGVTRDLFYTADPGGIRVTVASTRLSLPVPYGRSRASNLAVTERYLAVLDTSATVIDVMDRPFPAEAVFDHLRGNPNDAWLDLLVYLAERRLLPLRIAQVQETDGSYLDILKRNELVISPEMSPGFAISPDRTNRLFCALNPGSCAAGFSRTVPEVTVPLPTLQSTLETESIALNGVTVRDLVDQRVIPPEQRGSVTAAYLASINPDAGNMLEAEFARLNFVTSTPMSRDLGPGTIVRIVDGKEVVVARIGDLCDIIVKPTVSRTSLPSPLDVPAAVLPEVLRPPNTERVLVVMSGWQHEVLPLTSLKGCRPGTMEGSHLITEALIASEVRLANPNPSGRRGAASAVNGPFCVGYRTIPVSALALEVPKVSSNARGVKSLESGSPRLWAKSEGSFTLPITRWRADILVPAGDYYGSGGRLAVLRKLHPGFQLSARERLRVSAQSWALVPAAPSPELVKTLSDARTSLLNAITYDRDLALDSGTKAVYIGIVEQSQSVDVDNPGFGQDDQHAWYEYIDGVGLQQHHPAAAPPPPNYPSLRKLVTGVEHGTHVAGIIAARDSSLTPGLLPTTNLFLVPSDSLADLRTYIDRARKEGGFLFNMSLGFPPDSGDVVGALHEMMIRSWQDSLFVVAAGNGSRDLNAIGATAPVAWASEMQNVIAVAGSDEAGVLGDHLDPNESQNSRGSDFGSKYVDLLAPGKLISSLGREGYAYACGSSQAAPQVTAAAAMLWTQIRAPERLRARLIYTADWRSQYSDKVWGGLLNVRRAVSFPNTNLITTFTDRESHEIVLDGSARVELEGTEFLRGGGAAPALFDDRVAFNRILRMIEIGGGRHRVLFLDPNNTIRIVEGEVRGKVRCRSLTHYDPERREFGATPHDRQWCVPGIDAGEIMDYVAATPSSVRFK